MNIYVSTNVLKPSEPEKIFDYINPMGEIGIEFFPFWGCKGFEEALEASLPRLKEYKITMHGPYFDTEHSEPKGSEGYFKAVELFKKTLELCKELSCHHLVYHHNNKNLKGCNKLEIIKNSEENLLEINEMAKDYNVEIQVENAGVIANGNMLFDEEEFINMALSIENPILLDIGHAHANGWSLENVITRLKDKITSYHIHNNDGVHDSHNRIFDGSLDMESFIKLYVTHTPNADIVVEMGSHCDNQLKEIMDDIEKLKEMINNLTD